jgi:5-methylcytosine-specific restriction protein A
VIYKVGQHGELLDPQTKPKRKKDNRPSASKRGYNKRWRRFRAAFLRAHPICQYHAGCLSPAAHVHHLDGKGPNGPNGYLRANCQALCHRHHSHITAQEQPGGWAA